MKKIVLFVSVLLLTGSLFAAAPVFEAKPAISGDATVTFGINLDNSATGITNSTSTNLTLHLVNKDADEKGGAEGEEVYGWIKLKDFEMNIDGTLSVTKPGIEAKLFLGPVYINILGDSNASAKTETTMDIGITLNKDGDAVWDVLGLTTNVPVVGTKISYQDAGLYIGLKDTSIVDVKLGVMSRYNWTGSDAKAATYKLDTATGLVVVDAAAVAAVPANTTNLYVGWLSADLKAVPDLIFGVKANLGAFTATTLGYSVGVKAGYGITLMEGVKLTPEVGFDLNGNNEWRLEAGVGMTMPGSNKDDYTKFGGKFDLKPGLSVMFATGGDFDVTGGVAPMDLEVALFDGDLIPVLNVVAIAEFYGIQNAGAQAAFGVYADADLGVVVPYAGFQMVNGNDKAILQVGTDIKVITNTTFTIGYKSNDLTDDTNKLGVITVACKIAY